MGNAVLNTCTHRHTALPLFVWGRHGNWPHGGAGAACHCVPSVLFCFFLSLWLESHLFVQVLYDLLTPSVPDLSDDLICLKRKGDAGPGGEKRWGGAESDWMTIMTTLVSSVCGVRAEIRVRWDSCHMSGYQDFCISTRSAGEYIINIYLYIIDNQAHEDEWRWLSNLMPGIDFSFIFCSLRISENANKTIFLKGGVSVSAKSILSFSPEWLFTPWRSFFITHTPC